MATAGSSRTKTLVLVGLGLLLVFRLLIAVAFPPSGMSHDEENYVHMAEQMLDAGVYGYKSTESNAFVTPGYPLFLAGAMGLGRLLGLDDPLALLRVLQALLCIAALVPLYAATVRASSPRAGEIAVALGVVYPSWYMAQNRVLTEALFVFIFLSWVWLWGAVREGRDWRWHAAASALFAVAVLIRPSVLPLLPLVYLLYAIERREFRPAVLGALAALVAFSLVMAPWWVRNRVVLGETVLTATQSGNPLLRGTDPWDPYDNVGPTVIEDVPEEKQTEVAIERIKTGLRTEPLNWIAWFTVGKFWWLWGKPWMETWWFSVLVHVVAVLALGWAGVLAGLRDSRVRWLALCMLALTALHLVFIPIPRYMFPFTPVMFLLGAVLIDRLLSRRADKVAVD